MMAGLVRRERLLDKKNMRSGDVILMTKTAGVEGTSILAREFAAELVRQGMGRSEIEEGMAYLGKISILEEAALVSSFPGVRALHDVTEGGLATALVEMAAAGGHGIRVDMDGIRRSSLTERMCRLLGADSLGLIGSGSLLICCDRKISADLLESLASAGIGAAPIGEVMGKGEGVSALKGGTDTAWPLFEIDELARLFREKAQTDF
jgi:hydrogenase maturation factor